MITISRGVADNTDHLVFPNPRKTFTKHPEVS